MQRFLQLKSTEAKTSPNTTEDKLVCGTSSVASTFSIERAKPFKLRVPVRQDSEQLTRAISFASNAFGKPAPSEGGRKLSRQSSLLQSIEQMRKVEDSINVKWE